MIFAPNPPSFGQNGYFFAQRPPNLDQNGAQHPGKHFIHLVPHKPSQMLNFTSKAWKKPTKFWAWGQKIWNLGEKSMKRANCWDLGGNEQKLKKVAVKKFFQHFGRKRVIKGSPKRSKLWNLWGEKRAKSIKLGKGKGKKIWNLGRKKPLPIPKH